MTTSIGGLRFRDGVRSAARYATGLARRGPGPTHPAGPQRVHPSAVGAPGGRAHRAPHRPRCPLTPTSRNRPRRSRPTAASPTPPCSRPTARIRRSTCACGPSCAPVTRCWSPAPNSRSSGTRPGWLPRPRSAGCRSVPTPQFPYDDFAAALTVRPDLIVFINPNNPTGTPVDLSFVEKAARAADVPIIVDEAYSSSPTLPRCR